MYTFKWVIRPFNLIRQDLQRSSNTKDIGFSGVMIRNCFDLHLLCNTKSWNNTELYIAVHILLHVCGHGLQSSMCISEATSKCHFHSSWSSTSKISSIHVLPSVQSWLLYMKVSHDPNAQTNQSLGRVWAETKGLSYLRTCSEEINDKVIISYFSLLVQAVCGTLSASSLLKFPYI